jgi:hypothetical protein|tara:strand:- start:1528 stop:2913 length:1386 start_codon:yes stop_codon:yes gene_type:complete
VATSALSKVKKGGRAEQISLSLLRHAFPSLHFNGVATDAFGNALGNSFVASRTKAEEDRLKASAKPVDPDTGKFSPISETEAWSLERAIQQKNAREQATQASTPGWVNDDLLNYELGNYFAGVDEFNFTMDEGLMARVDNALLDASYRQAQQQTGPAMFGGFVESTPQNPMGLTPESLARANFVARNTLARFQGGLSYDELSYYEQQHYKIESERYLASLEGPQLVAQNPELVAREQQQRDFLRTGRPQPWHMPVSEMLNDGLMFTALRFSPGKFASAYAGYQAVDTGGSIYQNRELLSQEWAKAKANGGFIYADGLSFEGDIGVRANFAFGGFVAVNFNNWDVFGSVYATGELGAKLGMPNPTFSINHERTLFASPDYEAALSGEYSLHGAGDNWRSTNRALEVSYINAADGAISGIQFTSELKSWSPKIDAYRDPNVYSHFGTGAYYDWRAGEWKTGSN